MATPYFELGLETLTLTGGIQYPGESPLEKTQVTDRTAGGSLQVESLGLDIQRFRLVFRTDGTVADGIVDWFDNTSDGAANSFTYYDETGASFTVKMLTNPVVFKRTANDIYQGEILLEVVA